ncbi:MAG TPA: proprotein convertase P-domain-containing protein, partial [Pirellulaceae bacterium]|nr:proprotein convertase P-domain-containing protein [Pirellulaceae bacterium]
MASTTSSISVSMPAGTVVTDVNVTLTISHNRLSDVDAYLVSPTGVRIELFTDVGAMLNGGLDHVTLDDSAATSIAAATSGPMTPITGTYRPEGSLAEFIGGEESGTWHLELSDDLSSFSGTLESWSLEVSYSEPYAVSDAAGNYSLDVVPGDIRLREETPAGWTLTSPRIGYRDISVVGGETRSNLNFGNYENTTVSGLKFHDQDGDGVQDSTEPGLADWVIYLDTNNNGLRDNGSDATSSVPIVDIPDGDIVNSTMTVSAPSGMVLTDLNVTLNISHANDADLDVVLVSPWGERVTLLTDVGGTGNNFTNTTLDSAFGSSLFAIGSAPFTGTFRPDESLNVLNGFDPSGDWTLEITDDNGNGIDGTLVSWVLSYSYSEPFEKTDSTGNYAFEDVAPGRYELREEMQDGWLQTAPARGAYLINATSGSEFTKKAFGNTQPVAIEGFAFHDRTANGMYDGSDYGSAFWPVYVDLNHNAVRDQFVTTLAATGLPQATRDGATVMSSISATGLYGKVLDVNVAVDLTHATDSELTLWLVSPQGTTVQLVSATGGSGNNFTSTTFDDGASTAITSGAAPFTGSFRPTESLSSLINQNANGVWMLQIKDSGGADVGTLNAWSLEITSGDPSTTTDLYGDYSFDGLTPGTYVVREEPVSGWFQTAPVAPLFHTVTLASGDTATNVAFGNSMFATIEGYVYVDANGNGARDMGEGPLYNWTVYIDANGNGALDAGERRTTSDATGYYSIGNLRAGTYTVREVLQAGWKETEPAIGYRTVVLSSGARASNENFGNQPPARMAMSAPSSPPP